MSNPWTPGPWRTPSVGDAYEIIPASEDAIIGEVYGWSEDGTGEALANARLIASAPEMAEALQTLHDNIAEYARINNLGGFDNQDMRNARALLARIRGDAA